MDLSISVFVQPMQAMTVSIHKVVFRSLSTMSVSEKLGKYLLCPAPWPK
jgi:hypothetical protein